MYTVASAMNVQQMTSKIITANITKYVKDSRKKGSNR